MEETVEKGGVAKKKGNILKSPGFFGTVGFVFAILALLLCWIPILNCTLWVLGVIFSCIGMFLPRKGFAIAGLIVSGHISIVLFLMQFGDPGNFDPESFEGATQEDVRMW